MSTALHQYYAARAAEYDRVYDKPERQPDLRAIAQWLPQVLGGRRILEIACGTGHWTQFLAPVANGMLALDASHETLRIAQSRVQAGAVGFVRGDAYRLPVAQQKFDGAFAGFWYSHIPQRRVREFVQGLHATLLPGAKVVLLDNRFVEGSSTPIAERDAAGDTYQWRTLEDGSRHRVLKNFPSERALREAVAGLADEVRVHQWPYFWALEYVAGAQAS
ncbi:class I SAM-dependent methyltransferase [Pseudorhodoferax sp.]|uniref:class I SAM-dependent methyltransferase n=1 Tax=Pseudorhodoferax sp. TaxID=1993553 RepID=UPI002DD6A51B|nr:class I SAM-dependent methyltransferase [Pseudorhodoferax sp.]